MPFVQRVVQPVNVAQATAASSGHAATRFQCIPGKCKNNNCINNKQSPDEVDDGTATATSPTTLTKALVHSSSALTNGDQHEELQVPRPPPALPMKKLKQHVEFLSTSPTHQRVSQSLPNSRHTSQQRQPRNASAPQSPTAGNSGRVISGYEFDSISNITLSNALRQLASLVLIASDIFDDLQRDLQAVGERAGRVQRKIVAVERRVCAYDPKMVTVPESDLLTFAQRKQHYESEKSFQQQLFTTESRPQSVRQLYVEAAKELPGPHPISSASSTALTPPRSISFNGDILLNGDGLEFEASNNNNNNNNSEELVCESDFGNANRKLRTRIDAEIEIRLPAAIEDLRKWTSTEALGDVTVTPDCMHHVDTSLSTSMVIGDNGLLTPALSPSVLSADAIDASTTYAPNISQAVDSSQHQLLPNDINKDVPLNHRLPSPEEQTKLIALKYPAEVISVNTSGKHFQRMCAARKSTTGCYAGGSSSAAASNGGSPDDPQPDANNLDDNVQTVSRRSRSRKVRGKRRNTIAGIDQKEIQDAANGNANSNNNDAKNTSGANNSTATGGGTASDAKKSKKFGRSKSSDILKKETVALPYDKGKNTLTRLNSLKQWGRNRFKFMHRAEAVGGETSTLDTSGSSSQNTSTEKAESSSAADRGSSSANSGNKESVKRDIDDECVVHELISQKSESRFSHERKPSYSSSEKSMSVSSSGHLRGKLQLANMAASNVKMRETATLNRQRRNGQWAASGLAGKDEQPHSSSGNWSASSESGRASIGSEITIQPKSSASNTSLNVSSFHPGSGSGPPSSMMSRRRFLNTSASSSVTSEGTATPELQVVPDGAYPNHLDDETSSAYSCDTEGYYTSFHMDSGLRTLKEEEPPMTPLQQSLHTSSYSFGSQSNQTVLNAENEYELFGRGSTSTTTSSAGTVCTTLMINGASGGEGGSLNGHGPDVPERISSLGKLNKAGGGASSHSNSASTSTLERSYSSSTIGSTLERTGTIKRNVNAGLKLATNSEVEGTERNTAMDVDMPMHSGTPESQDDGEFDFDRIRKRSAHPLPGAELEYSECSDLEGVERIERIKQKTAINAKRIPSMCIITPTTSDDENQSKADESAYDPNRTLTNSSSGGSPCSKAAAKAHATLKVVTTYCTVDVNCANEAAAKEDADEALLTPTNATDSKDHNLNELKQTPTKALNSMFEKLKVVLPNIKRSPPSKSCQAMAKPASPSVVNNDELYDMAGEYVTIADISNNNRAHQLQAPKPAAGSLGIYYSNDIVHRRRLEADEPAGKQSGRAEYVSLNELPQHLRRHGASAAPPVGIAAVGGGGNAVESTDACAQHLPTTMAKTITASARQPTSESCGVPMYAEISELREEKSLVSSAGAGQRGGGGGARLVRTNAEGKIIYDSDSLKRRKGAHTTFAPGPYVKETESALASLPLVVSDERHAEGSATNVRTGESATQTGITTTTGVPALPLTKNAKLLLQKGGIAANRKVANVRPIVAKSPLSKTPNNNNNRDMSAYQPVAYNTYQEQKQMLANHTNPFYEAIASNTTPALNAAPGATIAMMPSPSSKSNSSTGSTATNSSSSTATTASAHSGEEGYQRFSNIYEQVQPAQPTDATPFQRNAPVYWTLQSRRSQPKPAVSGNITCRDDLYATPIRRADRLARAAASNAPTAGDAAVKSNISPIVPRNRSGAFLTSTPTRGDEPQNAASVAPVPMKQPARNWDDNSPERLNTCADRIGHSKTTLLDFKKLLLAKSAKTNPVQRKMSAVELLKKSTGQDNGPPKAAQSRKAASGVPAATASAASKQTLNSSLKLLDLSGSPKTFANRRMLRQGQFGSPSKSFAPKVRGPSAAAAAVQRTEIMSTTIPEANSEEDHSNTSGGSRGSSEAGDTAATAKSIAATNFDLKRNFFLQNEENNFMRGELKPSFNRAAGISEHNKYVSAPVAGPGVELKPPPATLPAFETAL
ncbi:uncharacterized protein LOC115620212 isoform X2 [Scaptodrosophila lebanonensis]|uniref:Uncharacterized protein LOC115620212 isoform X2 n=1 Tax=Drosophila lebanonensis TaxID=7225 RepID=A0A6J2T1S8_DROLE|nr:uncharacterized protein LOC115620212 isoform X2 [Scaptodrosophila lebanonensis]